MINYLKNFSSDDKNFDNKSILVKIITAIDLDVDT